jgi:hypothetical protein
MHSNGLSAYLATTAQPVAGHSDYEGLDAFNKAPAKAKKAGLFGKLFKKPYGLVDQLAMAVTMQHKWRRRPTRKGLQKTESMLYQPLLYYVLVLTAVQT